MDSAYVSRSAPHSTAREKLLHHPPALVLEHAAGDLQAVIQPGRLVRAAGRHERAGLWLGGAEHDPGDARVDHRAHAHQARLDGDVEKQPVSR